MKHLYLLLFFVFACGTLSAQEDQLSQEEKERREENVQAGNPFAKFGYKAKVATLSKGKYLEVHDLDSIVVIGTSYWNVYQNKIVGEVVQDSTDMYAQPIGDVTGRWLSPDPLSDEFPEWSPYTSMNDNPIMFIDPTGLAPELVNSSDFDQIDFEDGSRGISSTVVDETGKIIDHQDDGDDNIYLNSRQGTVIGKEQANETYDVGGYLNQDDLFSNAHLPDGFIVQLKADLSELRTNFEVSPLIGGFYRGGLSWLVYIARGSKGIKYVGITSQFAIRQATHLREKGIFIEKALEGLSKADARAVEQVLIEMYKLGGKSGQTGQLLNKINSISAKNPAYGQSLQRGMELLKDIKF